MQYDELGKEESCLQSPGEALLVLEVGHQQLRLDTSNSFEAELGT